jgi:hypothetical protein
MHRGTTSSYGTPSFLMDGNTSTAWLSNADTNFPNAQWVYVDLGSNQTPNAVTIVWGDPYATQFTVQYWPLSSSNQWSPYNHTSNDWLNTSAANVVGVGGTQGVTFSRSRPVLTDSFNGQLGLAGAVFHRGMDRLQRRHPSQQKRLDRHGQQPRTRLGAWFPAPTWRTR